ncbi:MAG: aminotransferase class IV [Bacteroidales bacterium]|nr:aminotransferase class IV [Bacteroidales bacterium]
MDTILGKYFLRGNDLREDYEFDNSFLSMGNNFYEVVRIQDGVVLFLEDHLNRLEESARKSGLRPFVSAPEMRKLLFRLIRANKMTTGNLKFIFHFGSGDWEKVFFAYPVPFNYPDEEAYNKGVKTDIFKFDRPNPAVKNWFAKYKEEITGIKAERNLYELILESASGTITEGSQSNLFVIKKDKIYTCPKDKVLEGITRKKLLSVCEANSISIEEKVFDREFLLNADAVFLTGTSAKILPVSEIGEKSISVSNPLLKKLAGLYDSLILEYVNLHKNEF